MRPNGFLDQDIGTVSDALVEKLELAWVYAEDCKVSTWNGQAAIPRLAAKVVSRASTPQVKPKELVGLDLAE